MLEGEKKGAWKSCLDSILQKKGSLLLFECNYDINEIKISSCFYYELLQWWSEIRESKNPENDYRYMYIIWNNKNIKIEGRTVFYSTKSTTSTEDSSFSRSNGSGSFAVVLMAAITFNTTEVNYMYMYRLFKT